MPERPFPLIGVTSSEETLDALRQHLKLTTNIPHIEAAHPIAGAFDPLDPIAGEIIICCHDDANEVKHRVFYPAKLIDPDNPRANELMRWHLSRVITASHN